MLKTRSYLFLLCSLCILWLTPHSLADDVGLVSARLVESEGNAYALQVDLPPSLLSVVHAPILPAGFTNAPAEYARQGARINVTYPIHGPRPLDPSDTLLLPWARTGALIHAKWADGSRGSAMFLARLGGIPVAIDQLRIIEPSLSEQIRSAFRAGLQAASNNWKLWLLVLCVALLFPPREAMRFLWMLAAGFSVALTLYDVIALTLPESFAVGLALLATLCAARLPSKRLAPLFILTALSLGLSHVTAGASGPRLASALGALLFFAGGGALLILMRKGLPLPDKPGVAAVLIGACAVAGLLQTIFDQAPAPIQPRATAMPSLAPTKSNAKQAPRELSNPFMSFLTIEPYETRVELMASGTAITDLLAFALDTPNQIAVDEQAALIEAAIRAVERRFTITIDGRDATPALKRGDFLTLGAAGAFTRGGAVNEPIDSAILGLTFVYLQPSPPEAVNLTWSDPPSEKLPLILIDPSGNQGVTFTADRPATTWRNDGAVFDALELTSVGVDPPRWSPWAALFLLAAFSGLRAPRAGYACVALSIVLFPVARVPLPFGAPLNADQAEAVTERLLTNVYHAFDFRAESAIYDQLAISVAGDQLTEIYLGQRRALELENRGGARARVETVSVSAVDAVRKTKHGVAIDARWNVSGSVNHFGHMHYRRDAYDATLLLTNVGGVWKISGIEVHEEERVY